MAVPENKKVPCRPGALAFANMIKALHAGVLNCREVADECGLCYLTVLHHCRALRKAGMLHIARREPDARGRHNILVYKLGPGKDAPHVRLTKAEYNERQRAKEKAALLIARTAGTLVPGRGGRLKPAAVKCANGVPATSAS